MPTWSGFAYTAFVTDVYSRMIVGWRTAWSMTADLVTDALEMAIFSRRHQLLAGVIAHSDAGSKYVSVAYTERLAEIHALASIGSIGDSYDNALAESVNGLYKTELIRRQGPWRHAEHVELATLPSTEGGLGVPEPRVLVLDCLLSSMTVTSLGPGGVARASTPVLR